MTEPTVIRVMGQARAPLEIEMIKTLRRASPRRSDEVDALAGCDLAVIWLAVIWLAVVWL